MEAGKRTINDFFNGSKALEIPFFQRAYVWGKDDTDLWERMLGDLKNVSRSKEPYFMGSVILKQKPTDSSGSIGDVRTVIDGQQRLTTLSILLKVLCLKKGETKKFDKRFRLDDESTVIRHNYNDLAAFSTIMDLTELEDLNGQDNITRAYKFYREHLNPDEIDFETVTTKILFVGIDLSQDEDEQQIFDTINSLGVRLTTAELLKNYFFSREDIERYHKYWRNIFESDEETKEYWDKEVSGGRMKRTFLDLFFYSYLQIKIQDSSIGVRNEDKLIFTKVEKVFDSYKKFIEAYYDGNKDSILEEIRDYAEIFRRSIDPTIVDNELSDKTGLERINTIIFALDTATLIPYILFVEKNLTDPKCRDELYEFLEAYLMRRLITKESSKNYSQLFNERLIMNRILTVQDFQNYLANQDEKTNRMPTDIDIENSFKNSRLTNKQAAGILYMIESKVRDRERQSTQLLGIGKYTLEHLMPKKWGNNWSSPGDEQAENLRDRLLLTLGNLTIITQPLNSSIRDADWHTKKVGCGTKGGLEKYASGIETLSDALTLDYWDETTILSRAEYLSSKALEIWRITTI